MPAPGISLSATEQTRRVSVIMGRKVSEPPSMRFSFASHHRPLSDNPVGQGTGLFVGVCPTDVQTIWLWGKGLPAALILGCGGIGLLRSRSGFKMTVSQGEPSVNRHGPKPPMLALSVPGLRRPGLGNTRRVLSLNAGVWRWLWAAIGTMQVQRPGPKRRHAFLRRGHS